MLIRYGAAWNRKWDGVDADAVKADWERELSGISGNAIRYALEHLPPEFPPTVAQFKALCISRPEPERKWLPAPKVDPKVIEEALSKLKSLTVQKERFDWAYSLQEREKDGEALTEEQRAMWRKALEVAPTSSSTPGAFTLIANELLPPRMRA